MYCALVTMGYQSFKLVEGKTIPQTFRDRPLEALDGSSFRPVAASGTAFTQTAIFIDPALYK